MKSLAGLISWIPSPWAHKTSNANPPAQQVGSLEDLPLEILYLIAESLDPAAKACLSLCNHRLHGLFGQKHPFRIRTEAWHTLHTSLARGHPSLIYCRLCAHVHRREDISPPGPAWQTTASFPRHGTEPAMRGLQWCLAVHQTESLYQFNYMHVQLAMKRHACGPEHGIATADLAHVEVLTVPSRRLTSLLSVEAEVCAAPRGQASLCLRLQNWALLREPHVHRLPFMRICAHRNVHVPHVSAVIQKGLEEYRWRAFEARESGTRTGTGTETPSEPPQTFHCPSCDTTYQVEVRTCGDDGVAVVVTKWLDLGAGLDPQDHDWTRHIFGDRLDRRAAMHALPEESVRTRFERSSAVSREDLTRRNSGLLEGRAYTRKMDHWFDHVWVLQGNKRLPIYCYLPPKKNVLASQVRHRS
ncbi:F-box domain protein [Aspergillus clavatus NRRL 1]|uniref:F-box domain protein n=1 Tax=Aspergillus clavatus (strain ATCC 1007 / CBS 513.65 / DSM 816 / NCTC 3887 / NRRL 1 / QM 1276 / 107) TaxID=344612 RepID=A1CG67_ASPCL|nr:F-box domain protein [Aspergillus clavatus NRRL 1]EAW10947.1 F-box domain protein [Aspergillus clavatus NRRL 1]